MKKNIIAIILLVVFSLSLLAGCTQKVKIVTSDEAEKIALAQAGISKDQATDIHTHIVTEQGLTCYSIHITAGDKEYSFVISAADGAILSSGNEISH